MFKGAIDDLHPQRVGGWIYSQQASLKDTTVLAFVDDKCVGAGKVDLFRKDLADAGLGDGYLGYSFPIGLPDPSHVGRVYIKVEGSDAVILPPGSMVTSPNRSAVFSATHISLESIEWMRARGWLSPMDYTFLRGIHQIGAFEYSLVKPKTASSSEAGLLDAKAIAGDYLRLYALTGSAVESISVSASDRAGLVGAVLETFPKPMPVVAIHADKPGVISVVEGSQNDDVLAASLEGAITYPVGPDRVLFLNLLCGFEIDGEGSGNQLSLFVTSNN